MSKGVKSLIYVRTHVPRYHIYLWMYFNNSSGGVSQDVRIYSSISINSVWCLISLGLCVPDHKVLTCLSCPSMWGPRVFWVYVSGFESLVFLWVWISHPFFGLFPRIWVLWSVCEYASQGFLGGPAVEESACQCRRCGFDPWVGKIPWRRKWQPTPVFLPGKSHGQRSLAGYSPWGCKRVRHNLATKHQMPTCGMPVCLCANVAGIEVYDVCGICPWMLFLWNTCVYLSLCGFWSFCEYVTGCEVWSFGACTS